MNACINYELDVETGLNLFWVSTDRNVYELGPFGRLADGDTLAADGENARAARELEGGAPW